VRFERADESVGDNVGFVATVHVGWRRCYDCWQLLALLWREGGTVRKERHERQRHAAVGKMVATR